jgi:DNA-binding YbaB/EbfC family protein
MPQPNIQNMLKQAQDMMAAQQEAMEALKQERVETSSGGGMVKVVASGAGQLESLTIDPDAVDPEDVEMLQDMVLAAVNEALRQTQAIQEKAMEGAQGSGGFDPATALEALGLGGAGGGLGGLGGGPGGPGAPGAPGMNRAARRAQKKR